MEWVANARMYAPTPAVADAWRRLFDWVAETSGVPLTVIEHAAPQPLALLWRRTDLGAGMMCGFPWATWNEPHVPRPLPLAAPIPAPDAFGRQPVYWTDIVVRSDSAATSIADLAGARFAYTQVDSQSGYQAPRALFAHAAIAAGGRLFAATVGPLVTPRRVAESVVAGDADAGPLDAWWHALLQRHEPRLAERLRVIARTPATPLPLLVAAAGVPAGTRDRLTTALETVATAPELADVRAALLLHGFARVKENDYAILAGNARAIDALGYRELR